MKEWLEERQAGEWAELKSMCSAGHQRSQSLLKKQREDIEDLKREKEVIFLNFKRSLWLQEIDYGRIGGWIWGRMVAVAIG